MSTLSTAPAMTAKSVSAKGVWIVGVLIALLLAGAVSYYASASPDGLEKVAADHGIDRQVREHAAKGSPFADYQTEDVGDARLSGGLAGVIGVGTTLALGTGVFWLLRRRPATAPGTVGAANSGARNSGAANSGTGNG